MRKSSRGMALAAALAVSTGLAFAATETEIPLNITIVKPGTPMAKFVSKPGLSSLNGNPTVLGATLRLKDTGNALNTNTYNLPQANWKGLGNPPGSKGFKYSGAGASGDPCKVVIIKTNVIKAVCKGPDITLSTPIAGTEAIRLRITATGDDYCAEAGGTVLKNDPTLFKAKTAPEPVDCASPSGAFLD
jgi:hypothetical protein